MARVLKPQPRMSPIAEEYAATVMKLSKIVRDQSRRALDIAYRSEEARALDLYLPESDASDALPVLMFIHGGGWRNGYKEWMGFMAPAITCLPAIFVSEGTASAGGQNSRCPWRIAGARSNGSTTASPNTAETQTVSSSADTQPEDT